MATLVCQSCGASVRYDEPIPRDAECPGCRRDLRCCRNCRHYDVSFNNACTESMADPVVEKERRNFCEYFYFSRAAFRAGATAEAREANARAKLEALFGGGSGAAPKPRETAAPPTDRAAEARRKLDALFGPPPPAPDD
jgi:hypothetical protein